MIRNSSKKLLTLAIAMVLAMTFIAGIATLVGAQDGGLLPLPSRIFNQQAKPTGDVGGVQDDIGYSVALSGDGNIALVGMPGYNPGGQNLKGRAIVYTRSGSTWSQQQILQDPSGGGADAFGFSVDINAAGNVAVIGAYGWENGESDDGRGAAYVYRHNGSSWVLDKRLTASDGDKFDAFGTAVAISGEGNHVLVGATGEDRPDAGGTVLANGAVYAYTYTGANWAETDKIRPFADYQNDVFHKFGSSIAVDHFGNTAVIGAPGADPIAKDEGAAYIFTRAGTAWTKIATLTDIYGGEGDEFGTSVAIDGNGAVVMVGAPYADTNADDAGAVVAYLRNGSNYVFNQRITGQTNSAHFGQSVALNGTDGRTAVIGAPGDSARGAFSGAAFVFLRSDSAVWGEYAKLVPSDSAAGDNFGTSLGISDNRLTVLAGSPNHANKGAAYVFYDPQLVPTNTPEPGDLTNTPVPGSSTDTPAPPTVVPTITNTPTSTPPAVELLINGGLEDKDDSNQAVAWTKKKDTKDKVKCTKDPNKPISYEGLCVYQMKNINGLKGKTLQKIDPALVKPGDTLRLEGAVWASNNKAKAKVKLVVKYTDPNLERGKVVITLDGGSKQWVPFVDLATKGDLVHVTGVPSQVKVLLLNKSVGGKIRYDAVSVKRYEPGSLPPALSSDFGSVDTLPLP